MDVVTKVVRNGLMLSEGQRVAGVWSDEAGELVQETFVRAFNERARLAYDGLRPYQPYLLTICRNLLIDHAKKRGREVTQGLELALESIDAAQSPELENEGAALAPETLESVKRYVAQLEQPLADVYHQRYVLAQSQVQAAQALRLTRQRVRTLENKLRAGLSRQLRSHAHRQAHRQARKLQPKTGGTL